MPEMLLDTDYNKEAEEFQTHCGITALFDPDGLFKAGPVFKVAYGTKNRGQTSWGGDVYLASGDLSSLRRSGLLKDYSEFPLEFQENERPFSPDDRVNVVLVQSRYATDGGYNHDNDQPCVATAPNGDEVRVIHNGQLVNVDGLRAQLNKQPPETASDSVVFTQYVAEAPGATWDEKVLYAAYHIEGSYNFVIYAGGKMYAMRDKLASRPIAMAKVGERAWMISSEDSALKDASITPTRELKRGEIIRFDEEGPKILREGEDGMVGACAFERGYFMRKDSSFPTYEYPNEGDIPETWMKVEDFRKRVGMILAYENPHLRPNFVVGVQSSGVAYAEGTAQVYMVPHRELIIKDNGKKHSDERLFLGDYDKEGIKGRVIDGKLTVLESPFWKKANVVIEDDSIVRGNVSEAIVEEVFRLGAETVTFLSGYPMVVNGCYLGISMKTNEELRAYQCGGDVNRIAESIGATNVAYISNEGYIRAMKRKAEIVIPDNPAEIFIANGLCGGCITGIYPVDRFGNRYVLPQRELVPA